MAYGMTDQEIQTKVNDDVKHLFNVALHNNKDIFEDVRKKLQEILTILESILETNTYNKIQNGWTMTSNFSKILSNNSVTTTYAAYRDGIDNDIIIKNIESVCFKLTEIRQIITTQTEYVSISYEDPVGERKHATIKKRELFESDLVTFEQSLTEIKVNAQKVEREFMYPTKTNSSITFQVWNEGFFNFILNYTPTLTDNQAFEFYSAYVNTAIAKEEIYKAISRGDHVGWDAWDIYKEYVEARVDFVHNFSNSYKDAGDMGNVESKFQASGQQKSTVGHALESLSKIFNQVMVLNKAFNTEKLKPSERLLIAYNLYFTSENVKQLGAGAEQKANDLFLKTLN